jgi:hypothetical protein
MAFNDRVDDSSSEDDMADAFLSPTSPSFASPTTPGSADLLSVGTFGSRLNHTFLITNALSNYQHGRLQSEIHLNGEMLVAPAPVAGNAAQRDRAETSTGQEPSLLSSVADLQSWLLK